MTASAPFLDSASTAHRRRHHIDDREQFMKNTVAKELFIPESNALSFKSLLPFEIRSGLVPFYLGLDFDGRRARFGAGMSDSAIVRHCANLNLDLAIVLACE